MEQLDIKYVALYLRKSRGDEETALDKHRLVLSDMCKKYGWKSIEYSEIKSGDSIEMRPVFQQLLEDVKTNMYDAVCVFDYDRLGRGDEEDQGKIKKIFKNSKTLIITPDRRYDLTNEIDEENADDSGYYASRLPFLRIK